MVAFNVKTQICNLANGSLGLKNSINNIDTPKTDKEIIYAQWYDIVRQQCLKMLMPNFALQRTILAPATVPAAYAKSYRYAYNRPVNCLRVLGFGDIDVTEEDVLTIENNQIFTNVNYNSEPVMRFIEDVEDVSRFSPDFIMAFAFVLGKCTALSTTQDPNKKASLIKDALVEFTNSTAQNAQENKPIRRSVSNFRKGRWTTTPAGRRKQ